MVKKENACDLSDIKSMGGFSTPTKILIIGCGGTGAYVTGHIARLLAVLGTSRNAPYGGYHLILADGDKVEQKNLERQHFIRQDLNLNKAETLANRYSAAFGIEIQAVPSYLENLDDVLKYGPQLVIGCVDNNASRIIIDAWFNDDSSHYNGSFWIDAGNEENSGQVICGYRSSFYYNNNNRYNNDSQNEYSFSLPTVTEIYPNIFEKSKFNSELSCAELAEVAPQNMMTNITAATLVLNFVQKILQGKALRAHGTIFSVDNSFTTLLNTPENLAKVNNKRRRHWETV